MREASLIVADVNVEHPTAGLAREVFANLICERGNSGMLDSDGDLVKWLEAVNEPKRFAVLLDDAEPFQPIRGVGSLVYSGVDFTSNDLTDFVIDAQGYGYISLSPWLMRDSGYLNRWEEVFAEMPSLGFSPREGVVLLAHKLMDEFALFW
jgi:hypothetical protein